MRVSGWRWVAPGVLALGACGGYGGAFATAEGPDGPPALEAPVGGNDLIPAAPPADPAAPPSGAEVVAPLHETFGPARPVVGRVRAPKSPPPPIAERPNEDKPAPSALWVAGYWSWNPTLGDFAWVPGAWRVPPRDMIWVNGRWERDAEGWSRVPGSWSPRRTANRVKPVIDHLPAPAPEPAPADEKVSAATATLPPVAAASAPPFAPANPPAPGADRKAAADWRTDGPPADHPAENPGPAPNPNTFYVAGHYAPDGDRVVWNPGFWTPALPGWDWVPARWVRRPDGWEFREGAWSREPASTTGRRYTVARPAADGAGAGLPPAIVDAEAGAGTAAAFSAADREPTADRDGPRDLIGETEDVAQTGGPRQPGGAPRPQPTAVPYAPPYAVAPYPPPRPPAQAPRGNRTPRVPPLRRLLNRLR